MSRGVVRLYGHDQMLSGRPSATRPVATVRLTPDTFILYGDEHPAERKQEIFIA